MIKPRYSIFVLLTFYQVAAFAQITAYPLAAGRKFSPGHLVYYIDPIKGNDLSTGLKAARPWKSFHPLNQLILSAGDKVEILSPGVFYESLVLMGSGTLTAPVKINFAAGRYHFYPDSAFKQKMQISNTNNRPDGWKAIALYILNAKHIKVVGKDALIVLRGKMIETCIDHSEDITIDGFSFDYKRPTVSEMTVTDVGAGYAAITVHPDSKYSISDSLITWEGEGWRYQPGANWQVFDSVSGVLKRTTMPIAKVRFVETAPGKLLAYFKQNPGFQVGPTFQNRDIIRDCTGFFIQRSKNIYLKNIHLYFMHGMGMVSQFCENITMDGIIVQPQPGSGRTCAAWADILHFAGCKGKIEICNSYLSAANDDAINVHGLHLKIREILSPNQVKVAFMHRETFGFNPYEALDSIEFIHTATLLAMGSNIILHTEMLNSKEVLLTLKHPLPAAVALGDAVENTTATPKVWIHDNVIDRIPTRGILVTSRRKVLIEHNKIGNTFMSAILVADDAASWYESGMVKDLTIQQNRFVKCGGPVIDIHPENTEPGTTAVHSGIIISGNSFNLLGPKFFAAKSTAGITISSNTISGTFTGKKVEELMVLKDCTQVKVDSSNVMVAVKE